MRDEAETEAEQKAGTTQSRDESRRRAEPRADAEQRQRQDAEQRREAETTLRLKTGRVACNERVMREPEAGEARSFIGSAQQQLSARGDCSHAHPRRDVHLASLTPLTGAAGAQLREARARALHRLHAPRNNGRLH